jgi:hypothetical protein
MDLLRSSAWILITSGMKWRGALGYLPISLYIVQPSLHQVQGHEPIRPVVSAVSSQMIMLPKGGFSDQFLQLKMLPEALPSLLVFGVCLSCCLAFEGWFVRRSGQEAIKSLVDLSPQGSRIGLFH